MNMTEMSQLEKVSGLRALKNDLRDMADEFKALGMSGLGGRLDT